MSYLKATHILPADLLEQIQAYVDGECIYIPRIAESRRAWGAETSTRNELDNRNRQIYTDYLIGHSPHQLAEKYYLSLKSVQRILRQQSRG